MELYRVYCSHIQRVELSASSLHPDGAYMLIDSNQRIIGAWSGRGCRNIDRLLAETVAAKVMQLECRKQTTNDCHIMRNAECPDAPPPLYLQALQMTAQDFVNNMSSLFVTDIVNDSNRLYIVEVAAEAAISPVVELVEERVSDPKSHSPSKLAFSNFQGNKIFLLECGSAERYLWIGGRVSSQDTKRAKDFITRSRGEHTYVRDRMEPLLFKEKFSNVVDCFARKSETSVSVPKGPVLQAIDAEVRRMVDENFGTFSMLGDPNGPVGDGSRAGMLMSFADDEEGKLTVFRVVVTGNNRNLEECFSGASTPVVFSSSRAYAILYQCKNGSRALLYLWIGSRCPADVQAALALRCKEVFPPGVSPDQMHVQQGREPPLLLRIIAVKKGCPLVVWRTEAISDSRNIEQCIDISMVDVLLPNQSAIALQVPLSSLSPLSPWNARVHINASIVSDKQQSKDGINRFVASSINVRIEVGSACRESVRSAAHSVAVAVAYVMHAQQADREFEAAIHAGHRTGYATSAGDSHAVMHADCSYPMIDVPTSLQAIIKDEPSCMKDMPCALRPVRLFQVSHTRRSVGAIFVEEIGAGGIFTKEDLTHSDCFILDGGFDILYVWMGAECIFPSLALVTRVARRLIPAMRDTIKMLAKRNDSNSVPYEPNQMHFDSYFKIDSSKELNIEFIRDGEEPLYFAHYFRDWFLCDACSGTVAKRDVLFDPESLDDDEYKDSERGIDGRLLSESKRSALKYSETEEYRRNSIVQQEKKHRRSSTGESFTNVKLKSTPPPADYGGNSSDIGSPASDMEIISTSFYSPAMSPLNRRGSTGAMTPVSANTSPLVNENKGVDHFLKVRLKSSTASASIYELQSSPASDSNTTEKIDNCMSATISGTADTIVSIGIHHLPTQQRPVSASYTTLKQPSETKIDDFRNIKLKQTPPLKPINAEFTEDTEPSICVPQTYHNSGPMTDIKPVNGTSVDTNVSVNRRASTGMYNAPKSFVPPVVPSSKGEDFRQVKLKSTQPSKHQLLHQEDQKECGDLNSNKCEMNIGSSKMPTVLPTEVKAETNENIKYEKIVTSENFDSGPPHTLKPPSAGCCNVM